ncbi:hypothetical protein DFQ26_004398 [Actinomortierella ambigua]|nr:hypothetical protein DFQ26_004398 [Actinomortierella ambigua]
MGREMLASDLAAEPGWYQLFVVTSRDDPEQNMLSSCAIHLVDAIVGEPSLPLTNGSEGTEKKGEATKAVAAVKEVKCATAVRVVTPACYRGYGYGGWMMKQLWKYLEKRTDIQLSNLYSDVGDFYTRKGGWRWFRSDILRIPVNEFEALAGAAAGGATATEDRQRVVPITDNLLDHVIEHDAAMARQEIETRCSTTATDSKSTKTVVVAIRPHTRIIRWQRLRKEYDLALMKRRGLLDENVQLGAHGSMIPLSSSSLSSSSSSSSTSSNTTMATKPLQPLNHILWCQDIADRRFRIHRFCHGTREDSAQDRAEAMALLQAAVDDAKRLGVATLEIWNPHPTLETWLGLQAVERKIPLSNLGLCLGPLDVEGHSASWDIEWIRNEFYACL